MGFGSPRVGCCVLVVSLKESGKHVRAEKQNEAPTEETGRPLWTPGTGERRNQAVLTEE